LKRFAQGRLEDMAANLFLAAYDSRTYLPMEIFLPAERAAESILTPLFQAT
jgi:hypothetical protein